MSSNQQDPVRFEDQIGDKSMEKSHDVVQVPLPGITGGMKPSQVRLRSIQIIVCLPVFFFLFTSLLCVAQFYVAQSSHVEEFKAIVAVLENIVDSNCLEAPITNLKLVKPPELCPSGYQLIDIGNFLGTHPGCYDTEAGNFFSGSCPSGPKFISIPPIPADNFLFWREHLLCAKRNTGVMYINETSTCPKDFTRCRYSPGFICVGPGEICPISDIKVQVKGASVPKTYTSEPLGPSLNLNYANDPQVPRKLTRFDFALNGLVCLDLTESLARVYKQNTSAAYPLMKREEDGCEDFGLDFDAQIIDACPEKDFYKENLGPLLELPRIGEYVEGNNITLNARYTMSVKNSQSCHICRNDTKTGLFSIQQQLRQLKHTYWVFSKYGLILALVMVLTACFNLYSYCDLQKNILGTYFRVARVNACVFSYMIGHFLTAGVFAVKDFINISSSIEDLDEFVEAKCFTNNNINEALEDLHQDVLPTTLKMTINGGVIFAVGIITTTVLILANYILSGIKRIKNTTEESRPLKAQEVELESHQNQNPDDQEKGTSEPDNDNQEEKYEQ